MELRPQSGVDALSGLVAGPELIAEGFDDVIGRHADVRGSPLDRLQHRPEHPGHGAERRVLALVEAAETVEVTEELVGAVDEMNDHGCMGLDRAAGKPLRPGGKIPTTDAHDNKEVQWAIATVGFVYPVSPHSLPSSSRSSLSSLHPLGPRSHRSSGPLPVTTPNRGGPRATRCGIPGPPWG